MGHWGIEPWDNDSAADWFGDLMDATDLAGHVERALSQDPVAEWEEIRAAALVLRSLGRVYVWPIDDLDRHLALAADQLERVLTAGIFDETDDVATAIRAEVAELRSRLP